MSTTNRAFIKAYRHDTPSAAAPTPTYVRQSGGNAIWRTSIEFVAADYVLSAGTATNPLGQRSDQAVKHSVTPAAASAPQRPIGKRPLSSFTAQSPAEPPLTEPTFTPETVIASFHWPRICRTLWQQYGDQYERVADLLRASCRGNRSLVGVIGLHPGDGCTTTLLCLAIALATRRERAVLVDANFQAPRLANLLGVEPTTDWHDVLEHGIPVAEAVIQAARDGVDLLPLDTRGSGGSGGSRRDTGRLAAGLHTSVTAGVLRSAYDMVLVDLGALLAPQSFAAIDPLVRNMQIDAAVAVTDPRQAAHDDLILAEELLEESSCELLGVIENRSAKPPAGS